MADIENEGGVGPPLLPGTHRVVRTLDASEGPFAGTLVTSGDGVAVRVDAAALGGWVGWRFSGAEHVAAPLDVCRRRDGHDALLPWCTERVTAFLVRRTAAGAILTPGENSTLVISILRGLDEVGEGIEGVRAGEWWLTDGGRPVFVFGVGTDVRVGVVEIIDRVAEHSADKALKRALGTILEGLERAAPQPRIPHGLISAWEDDLLSIAAPQPLERGAHAPEPARRAARTGVERDLRPTAPRLRADRVRRQDGRRAVAMRPAPVALVRGVPDVIRARIRSLGRARHGRGTAQAPQGDQSARRGAERRVGVRRRSLIIAGAAATAVLAGGLLWPSGDAPGEVSDAVEGTPAGVRSPQGQESTPVETPTKPGVADAAEADAAEDVHVGAESTADAPETAIPALLDAIAECRAEEVSSCPAAVAADSAGVLDALASVGSDSSTTELVDEYGDVAVVRLRIGVPAEGEEASADAPGQLMVVLIRSADKWLVRDVYDVADQPG
ncbi:hypothetical protein [Microbacterium sp. MYb62]|uniref:hypothetical protein n=1 Tax=Microbacterium sp. MYb62 TaxID=1848690 RepID=UPI000CFB794D|nr:hypothetical protein [Microbacterium sp. MYb62]PRB15593.1 hypothetical protein CQ042_08905 [Microbacterium sp. MYb62]